MASYQYFELTRTASGRKSMVSRVDLSARPFNVQSFFWWHNEWRDDDEPGFASKLMFDPGDWDPIDESEASVITGGVL